MTQNQTWQCSQCHTNNGLDVLLCRRCETNRPTAARRGPQHGQVRSPAPAPQLAMTPTLAPRPTLAARPTRPVAPEPRRGVLIAVFAVVLVVVVFVFLVDWQDGTGPGKSAQPTLRSVQELLEQQVAADRPNVSTLEESWVPQVSSKQVGLVIAGKPIGIDDIHADYVSWKGRYPDALLLWSGDYASFQRGDFWVVVIDRPFSDPASANHWCDRESLGPGDCFARRISHTAGSGPNAVHR